MCWLGAAATTATVVFDTSIYTVLITSYTQAAAAAIINISTIKGCVIRGNGFCNIDKFFTAWPKR